MLTGALPEYSTFSGTGGTITSQGLPHDNLYDTTSSSSNATQWYDFTTITPDISNVTKTVNFPDLHKLEWEKFLDKYIPVVVYLTILCVVGSIGNAHAFLVYYFRYKTSNHKMFVVWLAAVDFVACTFSIPFEIMDARHSYTFTSVSACKVFRFLNHFVNLCSGILLGVIAVERYRKACVPMGRQLSAKEAKYSCFVTVIVSIVLSIPALIFYGPTSKPVDNFPEIIGSDCTVSKLYKKTFFKIYSSLLLLLCTVVFIVCVVTYTFIGRVLYRQMKFRRASQTASPKQRLSSLSSCRGGAISSDGGVTTTLKKDEYSAQVHEDESSYGDHNRKSLTRSLSAVSAFKMSAKKMKIFDRSKQITFMFLVATAVSYAGYLPHLVLVIIQGVSRATYNNISVSTAKVI
ncbi:neuropeptide Y receptor type 6-like isoform X2 [Ylistrum balloti]|uniref:neuropeptide Y receptor type 6-like isoform X2 n=1 Tax=Ylistrum balloti TaxID=509963 RepID=UPI0029059649|nr:neuropeptide Y receptor type 6-like isoform X2 [Ylistrum balloti]